ncbi:MAG: hypothetical protein WCE92_03665, partial [Nitrososphaeraceae archaeon]
IYRLELPNNSIHELIHINVFEKDDVRDVLHGLVDELDKEQVTEILHDVLTQLYAKPRSISQF